MFVNKTQVDGIPEKGQDMPHKTQPGLSSVPRSPFATCQHGPWKAFGGIFGRSGEGAALGLYPQEVCERHSSVASCWIFWLGDTTAGFTAPTAPAKFPALESGTHSCVIKGSQFLQQTPVITFGSEASLTKVPDHPYVLELILPGSILTLLPHLQVRLPSSAVSPLVFGL